MMKVSEAMQKKVGKVMGEYKRGDLTSNKKVVKNRDQAIAIAMSEANLPMRGQRTATNRKYAK